MVPVLSSRRQPVNSATFYIEPHEACIFCRPLRSTVEARLRPAELCNLLSVGLQHRKVADTVIAATVHIAVVTLLGRAVPVQAETRTLADLRSFRPDMFWPLSVERRTRFRRPLLPALYVLALYARDRRYRQSSFSMVPDALLRRQRSPLNVSSLSTNRIFAPATVTVKARYARWKL